MTVRTVLWYCTTGLPLHPENQLGSEGSFTVLVSTSTSTLVCHNQDIGAECGTYCKRILIRERTSAVYFTHLKFLDQIRTILHNKYWNDPFFAHTPTNGEWLTIRSLAPQRAPTPQSIFHAKNKNSSSQCWVTQNRTFLSPIENLHEPSPTREYIFDHVEPYIGTIQITSAEHISNGPSS